MKFGGRLALLLVGGGGESGVECWAVSLEEDEGTCWNARVTSCKDILEGTGTVGLLDGGGVSPSSDFTSCSVNGKPVKSSAMPSSELTTWPLLFPEGCDHTALRCSGSGARAGESLKLLGDLGQLV